MPILGLLMIVLTSLEMIIMAAKSLTEITKKKVSIGPHIVAQGNLVRDQEVEAAKINLIETGAIRDIADQREEIQGHPTGTLLVDMTTLKTEVQILTKVLPAQPILDKVILRMTVEIDDPTNVEMTSQKTQAIGLHHPEGIILPQAVEATHLI
jgi:predicted thioredoxin/glutaredoxin